MGGRSMKSVDVAAGTIEYRDVGNSDGPPVVLLHGLLMNDTLWNPALPLLPQGFRYLLPVLPMGGHRIPMRPDADLSMAGMVGIVADFLDALDLSDVTLVVTDWGGPLFLTDAGRDKRVSQQLVDAWLVHALDDKRVRGDLAKYCQTRLDGDKLVRATNRLAGFDHPALVLWSHNHVM